MSIRHFISLADIEPSHLRNILSAACKLKKERENGKTNNALAGKTLAMIFEKNSTRTRVSFEVGVRELGGDAIYLSSRDSQLGRGESIEDTAKVISRYVHLIMLRSNSHDALLQLAQNSNAPVINGLTDELHPCQLMADIFTIEEKLGDIKEQTITWIGDGNNMANSWINAAVKFGFKLHIACPKDYMPGQKYIDAAKERAANIEFFDDAITAASGSNVVVTDTWFSMGDDENKAKLEALKPLKVTTDVMAAAKDDAIFMHCLPAHRGEEVDAEVIDGKHSVVFDEAENRLHVQKAIMLWCANAI